MTTIILRVASDAARQILEAMMTTAEYEKTFIERVRDEGMAEGEAKGRARGKAEGRAVGKAESRAEDILKLLDSRGLAPTDEQRRHVTSTMDSARLGLWFDRALTASTAAEVFAD
jgi:predicted transposase YdaD